MNLLRVHFYLLRRVRAGLRNLFLRLFFLLVVRVVVTVFFLLRGLRDLRLWGRLRLLRGGLLRARQLGLRRLRGRGDGRRGRGRDVRRVRVLRGLCVRVREPALQFRAHVDALRPALRERRVDLDDVPHGEVDHVRPLLRVRLRSLSVLEDRHPL